MLGQLKERFARFEDLREIYQKGLHNCHNCILLWISLTNVVEKIDGFSHAQNVYSQVKEVNPCNPKLWAVEIDRCLENGKKNKACLLMMRALQDVNINISLILILMITNLIKIDLKTQIILSYSFHVIKALYSIKSNFMIFDKFLLHLQNEQICPPTDLTLATT